MSDDKKERKFPDGVIQIEGTLHKVPFDLVTVPPPPDPEAPKPAKYGWFNLRHWTVEHGATGHGFENEEMTRLGENLRERGMIDPLICRWASQEVKVKGEDGEAKTEIQWFPQLVDGERRWKKIEFFRRKHEKVKNAATGEYEDAAVVYQDVLCNIYDVPDDIEALKLAYRHGKSRVDFGPEVDLKLVMEFRNYGATDQEILDVTGNDEKWLAGMDKIINNLKDDEQTLQAFCQGALRFDSAVAFAEVANVEVRHEALETALAYTADDTKKQILKLEERIYKQREKIEVIRAEKAEAEHRGDEAGVKEAERKEQEATQRVENTKGKKGRIKPQVGGRMARASIREAGGAAAEPPRPISSSGIKKKYLQPVEDAIKADGNDADGKFLAPVDLLMAFKVILSAILDGETEPLKLFRKQGKKFNEEWKKK